MMTNSRWFIVTSFVVVVLISAIIFALSYFFRMLPSFGDQTPEVSTTTSNQQLLETNQTYQEAERLAQSGNYKGAIVDYAKVLDGSLTSAQRGQVEYKIAVSTEASGDLVDAVASLKDIAANQQYPKLVRSYAVTYMGRMYYSYYDPNITKQVFTGSYAGMVRPEDKNDISIAYRRLFEYASSIYPFAVSELYIAQWYATAIASLPQETSISSTTQQAIIQYKRIIRGKLESADNDLVRLEQDPNNASTLAVALGRKASVLSTLVLSGDTSFGDPEPVFKQSLQNAQSIKSATIEATARFNYALFLAQVYGVKRQTDIESILSPLYDSDNFRNTSMFATFINKKDKPGAMQKNILLLASIDPKFKALLVSLGWEF